MSIKQVFSIFFTLIILSVFVIPVHAVTWEPIIEIAGSSGHQYHKPEIVFGPSGTVYAVYRDRYQGNSDIMLFKWDGKNKEYENVSDLGKVWSRFDAEESDIAVDQDEVIHVAWIGADGNNISTRHIMYRFKDGDTWSEIFYLGKLYLPGEREYVIDTRLAVDSMKNVHVVTCIDQHKGDEHSRLSSPSYGGVKTSWYVAKYGDVVTELWQIPGHLAKHPDVVANDNHVFINWMYKTNSDYWIFAMKWENKLGADKGTPIVVSDPRPPAYTQKSRIDLDLEGKMHVVELKKNSDQLRKVRYFKEQPDGSFSPGKIISKDQFLNLHKTDLRVRPNSILVTLQQGQSLGSTKNGAGVWYIWQRNGQWGTCTRIPDSENAVYPSNDLSHDGEIAAVAWSQNTNRILMTSSAPISSTGTLETQFSQPNKVFWGSEITFDATPSADLNPDHAISQYTWDFGDGTIQTTSSPTITHMFDVYHTTVSVKLTISTDDGAAGELSKDIYIDALYGGTIFTITPKRIRTLFYNRKAFEVVWNDNPLNTSNGYPVISKYEIWRAPQSSTLTDSSYIKMGDVLANEHKYVDFNGVEDGTNYVYVIRSVDSEGHISPFGNVSATAKDKKNPEFLINKKK